MRVNRFLGLSMILGAGCLCLPACGSGSSCSDNNACGSGGSSGSAGTGGSAGSAGMGGSSGSGGTDGGAGTGGASGAGGDGGGCDQSKSPSAESCLVSDQYAVFVDGTAATNGDGSQASPYNNIADAVTNAGNKIILVCDTTYDEQVKLTAGTKLYGGFKCTDWSYEPGQRAVVAPTAEGYALEVDTVTAPIVIEDLEFDSADASAAGGSSVAAFVHGSGNVALRRDKLMAGKGVAGANGVLKKFTYPSQNALNGNGAVGLVEGATKQYTCPAGDTTTGGRGGSGGVPEDGKAGLPDFGGGQAGQAAQSCGSGGAGLDGNPAPAETPASGASTSGTLDASGWTPANGSNGKAGGPGQGGGGGASTATAGGGGGGCGGCGGAGGPAGGGGGASVALMVLDSTVSIDAGCELVSSNAGNGGSGAAGQSGETITGNGGIQASGACPGGAGGKGGNGAAGGGGAGGISVPVLWKGTAAPTVDTGATLTPGTKGAAGTGGKAGTNDGVDGVSKDVLQVQ